MKRSWSVPEIAIFAVTALLPTYVIRFHIGPIPTTLLEVAVLISIIALFISSLRGAEGDAAISRLLRFARKDKLLTIGSLLLIAAVVTSVVAAPNTRDALGIAKAYFVEPMLFAWLLLALKPDREKAFRAFVVGAAISAVAVIGVALVQFYHPSLIPAPWDTERRVTSVFGYPNAAALFLAPLAAPLLALPYGWALALLAIAVILLAHSAGGLLAVGAGLICYGLSQKHTRRRTVFMLVLAAIAAIVVLRAGSLTHELEAKQWSLRVRMIGYQETFRMLRAHPVTGAGLSGFPTAVAPYHTAQGVEIFQYPHNILLAIWSELGLLGVVAFGIIVVWFFKKGIQGMKGGEKGRQGAALTAAMVAILVHGLVDVPYFKNDLSLMFWLLVILVAL